MKGRISDYIPYGKENAVARNKLAKLTGIEDRANREMIKAENPRLLKEFEEAIVSSSHHCGYWRTDDPYEMAQCVKEAHNRCRKILQNVEPIEDFLYDKYGMKIRGNC